MRNPFRTSDGALLCAASVMLVAMSVAPGAQTNDEASRGTPVATSAIVQNADAYYGRLVTISAGVEQVLSETAFIVDQRRAVGANEVKAIGRPVLVIAPTLIGSVEPNEYVVLHGEIVRFDEEAIAKAAAGQALDLRSEILQKYRGQPVLVANSVIDSTYTELATQPPPPPKPAETAQ